MGYERGDKFTLAVDGNKIIGFYGNAVTNLNSLGAYFTWITPTKTEAKGGKRGKEWDDGANHEGVTKIHVKYGSKGIANIQFDYVNKGGHVEEGLVHGSGKSVNLEPFEINHLDKEYLLSVEGYYNETSSVIQALQFKTNMKTSELMGMDKSGTKFSLGCNGEKIVGFHGFADENLNSLGAYFITLPLTKLEAKGAPRGSLWDDGVLQGVKAIYVFYDDDVIRCIRFEYNYEGKVETRQHGAKYVDGKEGERLICRNPFLVAVILLDYPNEFITSIEGSYIKFPDNDTWIASLAFKTSKGRTSPTFGSVLGKNRVEFVLESKGCALVGFHGRSTFCALQSLGAYSRPMPPPPPPPDAEKLEGQCGDEGASLS
ncbi:unnamed protein product [Thlaspi arvense]|uniref:Jacalin-type lectin domain-containing protein n=1 Tax=Thlaspi arvense TaxID=13288 RepID=A0AAU9R9J2_THLAR|nr:unnamed protein product [Thlaspi arvense]